MNMEVISKGRNSFGKYVDHEFQFSFSLYLVLTDWLTDSVDKSPPWDLTFTQLVKFGAFYGTRRFITVFITARHWSLSYSPLFSKIHSNVIFPSTPSSYEWSLAFTFSNQNIVCILVTPVRATCHSHLILDLIILIIFCGAYNLWSSLSSLPPLLPS